MYSGELLKQVVVGEEDFSTKNSLKNIEDRRKR